MINENIQIGDIFQIGNQDGILTILISSIRQIRDSHYVCEYNGVLLDNTCYVDLNIYSCLDNIKILVGQNHDYKTYSYLITNQSQERNCYCYFKDEDIDFVFRVIQ